MKPEKIFLGKKFTTFSPLLLHFNNGLNLSGKPQ
jgi:hypothetical protein